jgi:hypothetical protein
MQQKQKRERSKFSFQTIIPINTFANRQIKFIFFCCFIEMVTDFKTFTMKIPPTEIK